MSHPKKNRAGRPKLPLFVFPAGIALVGILTIAAIGYITDRPSQAQAGYPEYTDEMIARGEDIFQANCAACHGSGGAGDPSAGVPALDSSMHAWHHPDSQIASLVRNGGVRMPAIGSGWSDTDIEAVLAYVKQWWRPDQRRSQYQASRANP